MSDYEKDDKQKQGSSGSGGGKSPTKFMERPGTKPEKKENEQSHPEFIEDDLDALENQEKQDDQDSTLNEGGSTSGEKQGWGKPAKKGDQKPDSRKFQEPEETDSRAGGSGGDAC